ncbi:MAG: HlyD family efflux transporter periplasmic adaptor subunit [Planctomycetia bacterium]|nr:HlyD family efflux transporter periplasmic adaptor subunit [Planctomycetia bacterium]
MNKPVLWIIGILAICTLVIAGQAQDKKESTTSISKPPETVKVEQGKFSVDINTKGVFEAEDFEELSIKLEAWTGMTVLSAVPHGTTVKKGDVLVKLDMEKFNKALKDLDIERELSDLAFKQAEEDFKTSQKLLPLDEAAAKQAFEYAQEDYKRFVEGDLPLLKRNAEFTSRSAKNFFDYASEELKQLEKMYKADDIKEETEEIILRRQRDTVENAKNNLLNSEKRANDQLKYELPRREQSMKEANERTKLNYEKSQITMPAQVRQKQLAFEKTKLERAKALERFQNMKADYDKMTNMVAPCDGIVYYGKATKGQWNSSSVESKLQPKGTLQNDDVYMTIIKSNKLAVRSTIDEKDRPFISTGDDVRIIPTVAPDNRIKGSVSSITAMPLGTSFEMRCKLNEATDGLSPGMTCNVKVKGYLKEKALTLPASAISFDEENESFVVYLPATGTEKPAKKTVKIGRRSADKVEILDGLAAGDSVLKEKPAK